MQVTIFTATFRKPLFGDTVLFSSKAHKNPLKIENYCMCNYMYNIMVAHIHFNTTVYFQCVHLGRKKKILPNFLVKTFRTL